MDNFCNYDLQSKAKKYSYIKYLLAIVEIFWLLLLLILFQGLGISKLLAELISDLLKNRYTVIPVYILLGYIGYLLLNFPLEFYHSFLWEHRFGLSKQNFILWLKDQIKSATISYIILVIFFEMFYYVTRNYPHNWWFVFSVFWIFFGFCQISSCSYHTTIFQI
ncbi:MAG: hypothetical protein NC908_02105 [Candidatus Omnitrophica bacterium]|nr:hypothetical protein [Candidatus Omnitrophota bacterium]